MSLSTNLPKYIKETGIIGSVSDQTTAVTEPVRGQDSREIELTLVLNVKPSVRYTTVHVPKYVQIKYVDTQIPLCDCRMIHSKPKGIKSVFT